MYISGMPVVQHSLTLPLLYLYQRIGSKSETIAQCFICHSISVFRIDLIHIVQKMHSQANMCFQTSTAFLVRNLSVWEIYLCWQISRSSLQQWLSNFSLKRVKSRFIIFLESSTTKFWHRLI